jgi:hypothetical protein
MREDLSVSRHQFARDAGYFNKRSLLPIPDQNPPTDGNYFAAIHRQKTASHRQPGGHPSAILPPDEKHITPGCVNPPSATG